MSKDNDMVGNSDLPYSLNEFTRKSNKVDFDNQPSQYDQDPLASKPFFKSSVYNTSHSNSVSLKGVSKYSISKSIEKSIQDHKSINQNKFKVKQDTYSTVKPTLQMQVSANRSIQVKVNQLQTKIGCGKIVDNLGLNINQHDSVSRGYQTLQENEIKKTFTSKRMTIPKRSEKVKQVKQSTEQNNASSMSQLRAKENMKTSFLDESGFQESFHMHQTLQYKQHPSNQMESFITEQLIEESPREKQQNPNTVRQSLQNFKMPASEVIKVSEVPQNSVGVSTQRQKSLASFADQAKFVSIDPASMRISQEAFPNIDKDNTLQSGKDIVYKHQGAFKSAKNSFAKNSIMQNQENISGKKPPSIIANIKVNEQIQQTSEDTDSYEDPKSQMITQKVTVVFNQKKQKEKSTKMTPFMMEQNIQFLKNNRAKKFRLEDVSSPNFVSRKSIQTLLKNSSAGLTHKLQGIQQSNMKQFNLTQRSKINPKFNETHRDKDLGEGHIRVPFDKGNQQHLQTAREKFFQGKQESKEEPSNMALEEMMKTVNRTSRYQYRREQPDQLDQIQSLAATSQTEDNGSPDNKDIEFGALSAAGSGSGREKTFSPKYYERTSKEQLDTQLNSNYPSKEELPHEKTPERGVVTQSSRVQIKRLQLPTHDKLKDSMPPGSAGASSEGRGNSFLFESKFRRENMMISQNTAKPIQQQVRQIRNKFTHKKKQGQKRQSLVLSDPEIGQFQEYEQQLRMVNERNLEIFEFNQKQLKKKQRQFMGTYLKQYPKEKVDEKEQIQQDQANQKLALDKMNNMFRKTLDINVAKAIHKKQTASVKNKFKGRLASIDMTQRGSIGTDNNGYSLDQYHWPNTSRQGQSGYDSKWAAQQIFNQSLDSGSASASNESNEQVAIKSHAGTSVFPMLSQKGSKKYDSGGHKIELNSKNRLKKPYKIHELLSPNAQVQIMKLEKEQSVTSRGPILSQQDRNTTYREGPFGQMRNSLVNLKEQMQRDHQPAPLKTAVPSSRNIQIEQYGEGFAMRIQAQRGKGNEILGGVDELPEIPTIMDERDISKQEDGNIITGDLEQNVDQIDFDRTFSPKTSSGVRIKKGSVVTLTGATGQSLNPTHISQHDRYRLMDLNSPNQKEKKKKFQGGSQRDKVSEEGSNSQHKKRKARQSQDFSSNYYMQMQQVSSRYSQSSRRSGAIKDIKQSKNLNEDIKYIEPPKETPNQQKRSSFQNNVVVSSGFGQVGVAISSGFDNQEQEQEYEYDQRESDSMYTSNHALPSQTNKKTSEENQALVTEQASQTFASNTYTISSPGKDINSPVQKLNATMGDGVQDFGGGVDLSYRDKDSSMYPKDSSTLIESKGADINLISNAQTLRSGQLQTLTLRSQQLQGISSNPSDLQQAKAQPLQRIKVDILKDLVNGSTESAQNSKWQAGDLTIIISQKGTPNTNNESYQLKLPSYPRGPALFPPNKAQAMIQQARFKRANHSIQPTYNGIPIAGHQNFQIQPTSIVRGESQQPSEEELYQHFIKNVQSLGKQMDDSVFKNLEQSIQSSAEGKSLDLQQKQGKVAAYYGRSRLQDKDSYFFQPKMQGRVMNYSIESMDMTENDQDINYDPLDMEYAPQALIVQAPPFPKSKNKKAQHGIPGASLQHHVVDFGDLQIVGSKTRPSQSRPGGTNAKKSPRTSNHLIDGNNMKDSQYTDANSYLPLPRGSIYEGNFQNTPSRNLIVKNVSLGQTPKREESIVQTPNLNQTVEIPNCPNTNRGSIESDSVPSPTVVTTPMITTVYSQKDNAFMQESKPIKDSDNPSNA